METMYLVQGSHKIDYSRASQSRSGLFFEGGQTNSTSPEADSAYGNAQLLPRFDSTEKQRSHVGLEVERAFRGEEFESSTVDYK